MSSHSSYLTVALLQLPSVGADPSRALDIGLRACREAAELGADVALFPEMWQVGYDLAADNLAQLATTEDGPFVSAFADLARELDMAIVATYLQAWPGAPRNAATLIDRHGTPVLTYAKVHTCDFGHEAALTPGHGFSAVDLNLGHDTVRIGLMTCYDREFPESARLLMLAGAEVILTPNACYLGEDRLGQFRARAYENMVGVAMANYARPASLSVDDPRECNGRSVAFSGMAYEHNGGPVDHTVAAAGAEAGIVLARFDLTALRAYRARETWGDAFRKPAAYTPLVANTPAPIFVRGSSRRAGEGRQ